MFKNSENWLSLVQDTLKEILASGHTEYENLLESMRYSVAAGGKRVRPMLCMKFAELCGAKGEASVYPACAVELIHTYSLVHDDLPCMDNDDMRRGKPSNHIVFGEDTALLAGDALQGMAFEAILSEKNIENMGYEKAAKCARVLANLSGTHGMVGGQVIDLKLEDEPGDADTIRLMHSLKTGALIKAACVMGCIAAGACDEEIKGAEKFADCIGLQFQLVDDILDVTSTTEVLGKPVNSDIENNKSTLVSIYGIEKCREMAQELTEEAIKALDVFKGDSEELKAFARALLVRNK